MRKTLLDLIQRNLDRDPRDAPAVYLEADCAAQDMAWMPDGAEPVIETTAVRVGGSRRGCSPSP